MKNKIVPGETLLTSVFNMANDAIIATDESQMIILFNKGAERSFGYSADEIIGKPLNILLPSSLTEINHKHISNYLIPTQVTFQMNELGKLFGRRKDGTIFQCEASISKNVDRDITIFTTVLRDITGRERHEESYREKYEHLENLLNCANAPIIVWDTQFEITRFNKAFEHLIGRNEKYVIGKSLEVLFPISSRKSTMELIRKTLESDKMEAIEINILNVDGSPQVFLWNLATVMSPDGKTSVATIAQGQNITKRKKAEEEIRILNEILGQELVEKKRQIEVIEKLTARLIAANKELALQNEEKEKRAAELILANEELGYQSEENGKVATELMLANIDLVCQNEEKEKRVTALNIAKENAEETDKLKSAFLQNMSYEMRTPLNGIIGFSGLLNYEDLSKEEIKEYTALVSQSGKRLIEIVNNVLDISKIQTGQVKIEQKPVLIESIFSDLLSYFSPIAKAKNISLNYHDSDNKSVTALTDETRLYQVLTNLLNNAIKYTKTGSIDFGFEIKDNLIQLYVRDTGIGIPLESYDRIFDRFIQTDKTLKKDSEGAGLGLSISRGLVDLLGGKIWVESEINQGSTFYFTIPYSPVVTARTDIKSSDVPAEPAHNVILIAEDDWVSFQYLNIILEKAGITVIHAENGEQAVELVRNTSNIDLILMDIRMPVMDGIEATKQIKQMRPDLPIIAQTAFAFREEKSKYLSVGFDEYLDKPLEFNKLNELLHLYLNKIN